MNQTGVAQVRRVVQADAGTVWSVFTDWPRHGRHVWLTEVEVKGPPGVGQVFVATTKLGPLRFADPMEVTIWTPPSDQPGFVRLDKRGRVLSGWAELEVRPLGADQSEVVWREEIRARGAEGRAALAPVERRISGLGAQLMVGRLARQLAREASGQDL